MRYTIIVREENDDRENEEQRTKEYGVQEKFF